MKLSKAERTLISKALLEHSRQQRSNAYACRLSPYPDDKAAAPKWTARARATAALRDRVKVGA